MKFKEHRGYTIKHDGFRWEVASEYRFKTLTQAKVFIDRMLDGGEKI